MAKTWIVRDPDAFFDPICEELPKRLSCEVLSQLEAEVRCAAPDTSPPDILVIGVETDRISIGKSLRQFCTRNPEVIVVVVSSHGAIDLPDGSFPVDEVVVRGGGAEASGHDQLVNTLVARMAVLANLRNVQARLCSELGQGNIIARSPAMIGVVQKLPSLAASLSTVLISGETGTGKELIARALHYLGPRGGKPFVTVDCGAIPENLVENELFGHVRGAYTDAGSGSPGLIQTADQGTLFLDEVEALPFVAQSRLLRFLQERQVRPIGQTEYTPVDARVIAATNTNLASCVERRVFREDLYYRLNVIPLTLPPLRERKSDIPHLVRYFVARYGDGSVIVPDGALSEWMAYDWPGNVRELENRIQAWVAEPFVPGGGSREGGDASTGLRRLADVRRDALVATERAYLHKLLTFSRGNISAAARSAEIDRKSLRQLLTKYGISAAQYRA